MFRQIVRGLRYLHTEKRLVHRDVKLENVLVDEAGVCRIADFGMARGMDDPNEWSEPNELQLPERDGLPIPSPPGGGIQRAVSLAVPRSGACARRDRPNTSTTTEEFQPGSLPYAAPELLGPPPLTSSLSMSGKTKAAALAGKSNSVFLSNPKSSLNATTIAPSKNPAPAQDIWALGVLLYALLMGRLPFMDSFEPRLVLKILGGECLFWSFLHFSPLFRVLSQVLYPMRFPVLPCLLLFPLRAPLLLVLPSSSPLSSGLRAKFYTSHSHSHLYLCFVLTGSPLPRRFSFASPSSYRRAYWVSKIPRRLLSPLFSTSHSPLRFDPCEAFPIFNQLFLPYYFPFLTS
jgi:serine/threonine protein kinase